ncbi:MAG: hypothetical protein ABI863_04750 [Ginsengibacter sp.]
MIYELCKLLNVSYEDSYDHSYIKIYKNISANSINDKDIKNSLQNVK